MKKATRESYGEILAKIGTDNKKIVVFDADLKGATKTNLFEKDNKDRFFEMGIAEQDMFSTAAGMATCGKIPFVSTFAMFAAGRAYDQIRNSICYPNLNVKICATHAGVTVGEDGATHQMIEDISLMRTIPNLTVCSPSSDIQTKWLIEEISKKDYPVYVRLSRKSTEEIYEKNQKFEIGKGIQIGDGDIATVIATGDVVIEAIKAQRELSKKGVHIRVVDIHTIKPIDKSLIIKCAKETSQIITIENHNIIGGLGSAVCEILAEEYPVKVKRMGIKDIFGQSGTADELMDFYEITSDNIIKKVIE